MNTLLVVISILFLISILVGYKRGFLKIALSLAITIASIIIVVALTPYISSWLQKSTPLGEMVKSKIEGLYEGEGDASTEILSVIESSKDEQIAAIEAADLPSVIREMLLENNNVEVYQALGVTTFVDYVGAYITKLISDIIAFLVTWIAVFIIAQVLMGVIGFIGKIPVVGGVNKIAGAAVGAGIGLIIVWILFILVTLLYNTAMGQACMADIGESRILTKLYNENILMKFITKF